MKRNTVIVILVAVVAALFLVNPFKFFQGRNPAATKPPAVEAKVLDPLISFAASAWQSPEDYILSCFEKHDIVFLGELTKIRQQVQLVSAIIPRLAEKGIALASSTPSPTASPTSTPCSPPRAGTRHGHGPS